jgi:hypothetical protein
MVAVSMGFGTHLLDQLVPRRQKTYSSICIVGDATYHSDTHLADLGRTPRKSSRQKPVPLPEIPPVTRTILLV